MDSKEFAQTFVSGMSSRDIYSAVSPTKPEDIATINKADLVKEVKRRMARQLVVAVVNGEVFAQDNSVFPIFRELYFLSLIHI